MTLQDSIEQFAHKKPQDDVCPVGKLFTQLNDADKKALLNAIEKNIPSVTITNALRKEGYKIAEVSVSNHKKGMCRCQNNK